MIVKRASKGDIKLKKHTHTTHPPHTHTHTKSMLDDLIKFIRIGIKGKITW